MLKESDRDAADENEYDNDEYDNDCDEYCVKFVYVYPNHIQLASLVETKMNDDAARAKDE